MNNQTSVPSKIVVEGVELDRILYRGQPVLTLPQIDNVHQRPDGTARKTFNRNRNRFVLEEDFFEVPYEEWSKILTVRLTDDQRPDRKGGRRGSLIMLRKSGYLLLVKPMNDDRAWFVQRELVKSYFELEEIKRGAGASRKHESEADAWLKGANLIIKRVDLGVRLGEDLYECRVNAVKEGTRLSGVDFLHHLPLIPKHDRRAGAWSLKPDRAGDLASLFWEGVRSLPPREQARCLELKHGHLAVRMTAALKALASRKVNFYRPDLYRGLKLHPAFIRSRAPVRVSFGLGVPQPYRVWLFDSSVLETAIEVLEGGES